jgi:hypothetical protein
MANAKLDRAIDMARRASGLKTEAAIIANDGLSHYGSKPGLLRVQKKHGSGYLPAFEVPNRTGFNLGPGKSVRLGMSRGVLAIVDVDDDAMRAAGDDPARSRLPDSNADKTDLSKAGILKVTPTSPPTKTLVVWPVYREIATGLELTEGGAIVTFDLTDEIAALSSGEKQLIGFFLKPDGTVEQVDSSAINTADPIDSLLGEVYGLRTPGAWMGSFWAISAGMADINSSAEILDARQWLNGPPISYSETNVSNPPSDAELDSAFGTPDVVGAGFSALVNDAGGDTNIYLVYSTGSVWITFLGTVAT